MNYRTLSFSLAEALLRTEGGRDEKPNSGAAPHAPPSFTITISREVGAFGWTVAAEVGRLLGWPVYDHKLLDKIAEELRRPPTALEGVDERPSSWLGECLSGLFAKYSVGADVYLKHLFGTVRGLGATGHCVIVGRGANFLLSPKTTLRVRLVAEGKDRARAFAEREGAPLANAEQRMHIVERERLDFIKRTFKEDPADPHHYDMVLNLSRLTPEEAAGLIVEALHRFESHAAVSSASPIARTSVGGKP